MNSPNFRRFNCRVLPRSYYFDLLLEKGWFSLWKRQIRSLKFRHVAAIERKQLFQMMICFDVTQVEMSGSPPSWYTHGKWSLIGPLLFKTIKTIDPFWEREEFNLVLVNKSNDNLTSHRSDEWVPSLVIGAWKIDFDWAASVEDNQNKISLLGEDRV